MFTKTKEQKAQSAENESKLNQKLYELNNQRNANTQNKERKRDLDMETEEDTKINSKKPLEQQRKSQIDTNQLKSMFGGLADKKKDDLEPDNYASKNRLN